MGRLVRVGLLAIFGIAIAVSSSASGRSWLYLVGLGFIVLSLITSGWIIKRRKGLLSALAVAIIVTAAAIVVPLVMSPSERGQTAWRVNTNANDAFPRGNEIILDTGVIIDTSRHQVFSPRTPLTGPITIGEELFYHQERDRSGIQAFNDKAELMWTIDATEHGTALVVAESDNITTIYRCDNTCQLEGIRRDGTQAWARNGLTAGTAGITYAQYLLDGTASRYFPTRPYVPSVIIATNTAPFERHILDPNTGETIHLTHSRHTVAAIKDTAVFMNPDKHPCELTAVTTSIVWTSRLDPNLCGDEIPRLYPVFDRLYVISNQNWISVDITNGSTLDITSRLKIRPQESFRDISLGDNLIITRASNNRTITGHDTTTGEKLWTKDLAGTTPPRIDPYPQGVITYSAGDSWNPFISADERNQSTLISLLDPHTGKTNKTALISDPLAAFALANGSLCIHSKDSVTVLE